MSIPLQKNEFFFTGRGSTALWLILKSLGSQNKKILLPVNICEIVVGVIRKLNFTPSFYDVDPVTGNATLTNIISKKTDEEILLAVHNFGRPLEIDKISTWSKKNDVFLIEDVCNTLGATWKGKELGSYGDAAIFSFGYAKIIDIGVGGALTVKDSNLLNKIHNFSAELPPFESSLSNELIQFNKKLSKLRSQEMNSAAEYIDLYDSYSQYFIHSLNESYVEQIKSKLSFLQKEIATRQEKADLYRKGITSSKILHRPLQEGEISWRYTLLCSTPKFRSTIIKTLINKSIPVSKWYPRVDKIFGYKQGEFPGAESFEQHVLNLFVNDKVSIDEVKRTIIIINSL